MPKRPKPPTRKRKPVLNARYNKAPQLEPLLIIPDVHAPYHDKRAVELVLSVGRVLKPKHLVTIGDVADFYAVSAHDKDARRMRVTSFQDELRDVNTLLDQLDALGATNKLAVEGNHEDRLKRYLMLHPALHDVFSTETLLRYRERGWSFTPYKRTATLGKLHLTHDVGAAGRNAAHKALDTYQHSVVTGHTHRMCYIVEGNAMGEAKLSASFGWLGDVEQIDYMHLHKAKKDWCLGFGTGYMNPSNGYVYLCPVPILPDYTCVVNGQLFQG